MRAAEKDERKVTVSEEKMRELNSSFSLATFLGKHSKKMLDIIVKSSFPNLGTLHEKINWTQNSTMISMKVTKIIAL